jgi:L-malate glycosyltransferase
MNQPRHLLHVFSTFSVGGPQVRACDLINHFGRRYRHTILAMDGNYACRERLDAAAPVEFAPLEVNKREPLKNYARFARRLGEVRPDLLLTYNWGAVEWGLANLLARACPHVHAEDGFNPDEVGGQKRRRVWARRLFLARAHRVVVPSRTLEKIAREVWRFPASRVIYIPNGVNLEKYAPSAAQPDLPQLAALRPGLVVGTVATLRPEKNIPRLIRVFTRATGDAAIPQARLVIVGGGPEYAGLRRQVAAEKLGDRVHLLGHLDDPAAAIRAFDVFAISSDTEQMPISILEAMAAGLPVVGTDVGDLREMIAPANRAHLSPPGDEEGFRRNLAALLCDAALRRELGGENRRRCAALFDKAAMFAAYGKLYDLAL